MNGCSGYNGNWDDSTRGNIGPLGVFMNALLFVRIRDLLLYKNAYCTASS